VRKWRNCSWPAACLKARFQAKANLLLSYLNRLIWGGTGASKDARPLVFEKPAAKLSFWRRPPCLVGCCFSHTATIPPAATPGAPQSRNGVLLKKLADHRAHQRRAVHRQAGATGFSFCVLPIALPLARSRSAASIFRSGARPTWRSVWEADVAAEGTSGRQPISTRACSRWWNNRLRRRPRLRRPARRRRGGGGGARFAQRRVLAIAGPRHRPHPVQPGHMALRQPGSPSNCSPPWPHCRSQAPAAAFAAMPHWQVRHSPFLRGNLSRAQPSRSATNTAALRLAQQVGSKKVSRWPRDLGIRTPLWAVSRPWPSVSKRGALDRAHRRLRGPSANGGIWPCPSTIRRLTDAENLRRASISARLP